MHETRKEHYEVPVASDEARVMIRKSLLSLGVVIVVAALTGWLLHDTLVSWGSAFVKQFGELGLFAIVVMIDSSPVPMTVEPLVALALKGGMDPLHVFALASTASMAAGMVGYTFGVFLRRFTDMAGRLRRWHPKVVGWVERKGAWGVVIAALTPIPYSLATWTSGILRVHPGHVFLATLVRIPKTGLYLLLILLGFGLDTTH